MSRFAVFRPPAPPGAGGGDRAGGRRPVASARRARSTTTGRPPVRVVVVGASSGLGRCLSVGLARRGARVALLARRRDRLERAAEEAGHGALAVECDVTSPVSAASAVAGAA